MRSLMKKSTRNTGAIAEPMPAATFMDIGVLRFGVRVARVDVRVCGCVRVHASPGRLCLRDGEQCRFYTSGGARGRRTSAVCAAGGCKPRASPLDNVGAKEELALGRIIGAQRGRRLGAVGAGHVHL